MENGRGFYAIGTNTELQKQSFMANAETSHAQLAEHNASVNERLMTPGQEYKLGS